LELVTVPKEPIVGVNRVDPKRKQRKQVNILFISPNVNNVNRKKDFVYTFCLHLKP